MAAWVVWLILAVLLRVAEVFIWPRCSGCLWCTRSPGTRRAHTLKRFGGDALVGRRAYADTEVIVYKRTVRVGRMSGPHASPASTS
jgi:hypothetical protein